MKIDSNQLNYLNILENYKQSSRINTTAGAKEQPQDLLELSADALEKFSEIQVPQESPLGDDPPIEPSDPDNPSDG